MKTIIGSKNPDRPINQFTNLSINQTKGGEKKMRHLKIIPALGVAVFVLATVVFLTNTWAKENVRMTKHNLSANTNITTTPSTTEVCIYCHTPHGGRTDVAGGAAPLWNRALSAATASTYNMYDSPNFDLGTNNRGNVPRGVSVACLSCHDGTVAFDAIINASGSGGYNSGNTGTGGTSIGHTLNGPLVEGDNSFAAGAGPFPNLGTTLTDDHPISMRICSGSAAHDRQFDDVCTNSSSPSNNPNILRISRTSGVFPTDIRDTIRAYKSEPTTDATGWYIECASCHNPHEASRPGDADGTDATTINNSRFLRLPSGIPGTIPQAAQDALTNGDRNAGSLLCLSCHQK